MAAGVELTEREADEVRHYGGLFVCESVAPKNRPLIAAAPDLLAALEAVRDCDRHVTDCPSDRGCPECTRLSVTAGELMAAALVKAGVQ